MARKVSKKRTQSLPMLAQYPFFKKNWWKKKDWKFMTYGVEWIAIVSSLFWAIEARTAEIKPSQDPNRSIAKIAPKQSLTTLTLPRNKYESPKQEGKLKFLSRVGASELISSENTLSSEFKRNPFYSPTTVVLIRF
jgi:hypothetical protein